MRERKRKYKLVYSGSMHLLGSTNLEILLLDSKPQNKLHNSVKPTNGLDYVRLTINFMALSH